VPADAARAAFAATGFVVRRRRFEPRPRAVDVDRVLEDGFGAEALRRRGAGGQFPYVPMMTAPTRPPWRYSTNRTGAAVQLPGRTLLPVRAEGNRCFGDSEEHQDSTVDVASVGSFAHLAPLTASSRRLRDDADTAAMPASEAASAGGGASTSSTICQARSDVTLVERYFDTTLSPDGPRRRRRPLPELRRHWQASDRPGVRRLAELGIYGRSDREKPDIRAKRRGRSA